MGWERNANFFLSLKSWERHPLISGVKIINYFLTLLLALLFVILKIKLYIFLAKLLSSTQFFFLIHIAFNIM